MARRPQDSAFGRSARSPLEQDTRARRPANRIVNVEGTVRAATPMASRHPASGSWTDRSRRKFRESDDVEGVWTGDSPPVQTAGLTLLVDYEEGGDHADDRRKADMNPQKSELLSHRCQVLVNKRSCEVDAEGGIGRPRVTLPGKGPLYQISQGSARGHTATASHQRRHACGHRPAMCRRSRCRDRAISSRRRACRFRTSGRRHWCLTRRASSCCHQTTPESAGAQ